MNELTKLVIFTSKFWNLRPEIKCVKLQCYMFLTVAVHNPNHNDPRQTSSHLATLGGRKWGASTVVSQKSPHAGPDRALTFTFLCVNAPSPTTCSGFLPESEKWVTASGKAGRHHHVTSPQPPWYRWGRDRPLRRQLGEEATWALNVALIQHALWSPETYEYA